MENKIWRLVDPILHGSLNCRRGCGIFLPKKSLLGAMIKLQETIYYIGHGSHVKDMYPTIKSSLFLFYFQSDKMGEKHIFCTFLAKNYNNTKLHLNSYIT